MALTVRERSFLRYIEKELGAQEVDPSAPQESYELTPAPGELRADAAPLEERVAAAHASVTEDAYGFRIPRPPRRKARRR